VITRADSCRQLHLTDRLGHQAVVHIAIIDCEMSRQRAIEAT